MGIVSWFIARLGRPKAIPACTQWDRSCLSSRRHDSTSCVISWGVRWAPQTVLAPRMCAGAADGAGAADSYVCRRRRRCWRRRVVWCARAPQMVQAPRVRAEQVPNIKFANYKVRWGGASLNGSSSSSRASGPASTRKVVSGLRFAAHRAPSQGGRAAIAQP